MTNEARDLQKQAVAKLVEVFKNKRETTFKAPTGSGKTFMMASFMNEILSANEKAVFVVPSLSKGDLGEQNYKAFCTFKEQFRHLKPFLIESKGTKEESLYIPLDYNVYVLPKDLYADKKKLKDQGVLVRFLRGLKGFKEKLSGEEYKEKQIYLIKDECHIATNNLDDLIIKPKNTEGRYFEKVLNVSATPKLTKGQFPDVCISEEEAMSARLIKRVEYDEEAGLEVALEKFLALKKDYVEHLGINPCFIIQISNKNKADEELKVIKENLNKERFSHLKWMFIVDDKESKNKSDTNDRIKTQNLSVKKWKSYAKSNQSTIDIIIFKMVISEGWDIPRACMLYQMRDSQSEQLDEQVIGRVRRNPYLLEFEGLSESLQELISVAYVYGIKPKSESSVGVRLRGENRGGLFENEVQKEFTIRTSRLQKIEDASSQNAFDVKSFLQKLGQKEARKNNIFGLYAQYKGNEPLYALCKNYVLEAENEELAVKNWFKFSVHFDEIKKGFEKIVCDYEKTLELVGEGQVLPLESVLQKTDFKREDIKWIWENNNKEFYFDSESEREWLGFLINLYDEDTPDKKQKLIKHLEINNERIYLLGKNFPYNSQLKFEYYLEGYHFSYPDFILKDWADRIHIFEVKSFNTSSEQNINSTEYDAKIQELKKLYKIIAQKTKYSFYIPIKKGDSWDIWSSEEEHLTQDQFKKKLRKNLKDSRI